MTTTLTEARKALAAALDAPDHVPESIDPPCVVIQPGDPWLSPDANFGWDSLIVRMEVFVLVDPKDNESMADDLDAATLPALDAIEKAGWGIQEGAISQPQPWDAAGWSAYGIRIQTTKRVSRDLPAEEPAP